jgi:hypothetical protein
MSYNGFQQQLFTTDTDEIETQYTTDSAVHSRTLYKV